MIDFSVFLTSEAWLSLLMLTFMEIVLGIDNIIFISIVANKLDKDQQAKARNIGLLLAMVFRIVLLFGIGYINKMQEPFWSFDVFSVHAGITGQSLILILGGLFLMYKSVSEIHGKLEGEEHTPKSKSAAATALNTAVFQIFVINIVFSFDSILTAIGLTQHIAVMILGVVLSVVIMMLFAGPVGRFVDEHPSIQMLGLSFLILIAFMLIAEGAHKAHLIGHPDEEEVIPKGYLYFAIFFSLGVEFLNIRLRKKHKPVQLRGVLEEGDETNVF
jgi:predicted tellurium resistance membrane protein TerC